MTYTNVYVVGIFSVQYANFPKINLPKDEQKVTLPHPDHQLSTSYFRDRRSFEPANPPLNTAGAIVLLRPYAPQGAKKIN